MLKIQRRRVQINLFGRAPLPGSLSVKITAIDCFPVTLQFKEPFVIANVSLYDLYYVIVRLSTDDGIVGYGEAIPAWEVTGETQLGVIDAIGYFCDPRKTGIDLIGEDITSFEDVKNLLERINPHRDLQRVWGAPSAKAAIEGAVLDAYGKAAGKPVYNLFGGANAPVPVTHVIGIYPVEETLRRVDAAVRSGAGIIKLKVGAENVDNLRNHQRDIEVIKQAKDLINAAGSTARLVADANQGYLIPETAIHVARKIDGCLDWLEQPILAGDKIGFRQIKQACDVNLMADESVHDIHDARLLLEWDAVDYINLKLMKTGGLIGALRIADLAAEHGVPCQMGSMLENQIGCAMCIHTYLCHANIVTTELCSLAMLRECIGSGIEIRDHHLCLPDRPGAGIHVEDGEIEKHLVGKRMISP